MSSSSDVAKLEAARLVGLVIDASGINDKDFADFIIDLAHNQSSSRSDFVDKVHEMDDTLGRDFAEKLYSVIMDNTSPARLAELARARNKSLSAASSGGEVKSEHGDYNDDHDGHGSGSRPTSGPIYAAGAVKHPERAAAFPGLAVPDGLLSRDMQKGDGASFTGLKPEDDKYDKKTDNASNTANSNRYNNNNSNNSSNSYSGGRDRNDRDSAYAPGSASGSGANNSYSDLPRLYGVYEAEVVKVVDYSATLSILGYATEASRRPGGILEAILPAAGLRHSGSAANAGSVPGAATAAGGLSGGALGEGGRVELRSVLRPRQRVWVKVLSEQNGKYSVSMRDVDQETGRDLRPIDPGMQRQQTRTTPYGSSADGGGGGEPPARPPLDPQQSQQRQRRVSSRERWQSQLLSASGVLGSTAELQRQRAHEQQQSSLPGYAYSALSSSSLAGIELIDRSSAQANGVAGGDEDIDIELNEEEPAFLRGQVAATLAMRGGADGAGGGDDGDSEAVKIVRMPHGSLQHAAVTQAAQAKERRAAHEQARLAAADAVPTDIGRGWHDPLAEDEDRILAVDARGVAAGHAADLEKNEMPEWKRETMGRNTTYGKVTTMSIKEQRESLPIFALRGALLNAVKDNQVLIVIGETGSGKTTQMTQYLAEAGYTAGRKIIGCTQPRRVAATSIAKRVADEVGCKVGAEVGYNVRFEDCTSADTVIKYMTDGMLLRELLMAPNLERYGVIILDEAHERTINTDVLFGLLKATLTRRPDMKLIVTSATLDAEKFSKYFGGAPIFTIPGRTFPVTVHYAQEPQTDYLEAALATVLDIHISQPPGDILVFLTGKEEIDTACELLYERCKALGRNMPPLEVLPVYSTLPSELQSRIFEPAARGSRKVVVATNIAEASLTIDGIIYVVDPGFCKIKAYNPKLGMDSLVIAPISQASASQRAGRAGRTGPGRCYRLYTMDAFKTEMMPSSVPEIQRTNLGNVVLTLKALGINDMLGFDFMDPPPANTMVTALHSLFVLGALDGDGLLTRLGRKMAEFPLEPQLSKILISSVDLECAEEVLTVVAMLSVDGVFHRPKDKQAQADARRAKFFQPEGDHLTLLAVYDSWQRANMSAAWCQVRMNAQYLLTIFNDTIFLSNSRFNAQFDYFYFTIYSNWFC